MDISEPDSARLTAFRSAARQVREASIISNGQAVWIQGHYNAEGQIEARIELLAEEPFRSLALAVRLVYQQGEPAHFFVVCNILSKHGSASMRSRVAALREAYQKALASEQAAIVIVDASGARSIYTPRQVLEHWLYGVAFHQDLDRQHQVRLLASASDAAFPLSVQSTCLQLAGRIMDLDDVVADFLGEAPLPRIEPGGAS